MRELRNRLRRGRLIKRFESVFDDARQCVAVANPIPEIRPGIAAIRIGIYGDTVF